MEKNELLTLPHIHKEINTCIDDNLEMICEKLNRIYTLSFIDLWNFNFDNSKEEIAKKIYLEDEVNTKNIQKYCGIILKDIQFNNFEETFNEIKKELQNNNPIMMHMYRRLFPWDINYLQENVPNFFTHKAMAIDIMDTKILFTDGYCNKFNKFLSISTCKKASTNKITKIHIIKNENLDIKQFFSEFKRNQENHLNMFYDLKNFSDYLRKIKLIKEIDNYKRDLYKYSPIYNSLNKIVRSRKKIKHLINTLGILLKSDTLIMLSKDFEKTISYWEYINFRFTKYAQNFDRKNLTISSKYIEEIIKEEKILYNRLRKVEV